MNFFKRPHLLRRYSRPKIERGYSTIPYEEKTFPMDVQTLEDVVITSPEGSRSVQRLKVFAIKNSWLKMKRISRKQIGCGFRESGLSAGHAG